MMPTMGGCQPCATILGSVSQGIVTPRIPGQGGGGSQSYASHSSPSGSSRGVRTKDAG